MPDPNVHGYLPEDVKPKHWTHEDKAQAKMAAKLKLDSYDLGEVDLRPYSSPVHDQKNLGSCVAQSVVKALEIKRIMQYGKEKHVDLSILALYYLARELMADKSKVTQDSGTHISHACDALRRWGICEESLWPYVTSGNTFAVAPPWRAMRRGYVNKIDSFYRIVSDGDARMDGILLHLHSGNPVVFGTAVPKSFFKTGKSTVVGPPKGSFVGRHAMCIVGWLPDHLGGVLVIENSWGKRFGDGGFFYASPDYIKSRHARDIWAIAGGWEDWL